MSSKRAIEQKLQKSKMPSLQKELEKPQSYQFLQIQTEKKDKKKSNPHHF